MFCGSDVLASVLALLTQEMTPRPTLPPPLPFVALSVLTLTSDDSLSTSPNAASKDKEGGATTTTANAGAGAHKDQKSHGQPCQPVHHAVQPEGGAPVDRGAPQQQQQGNTDQYPRPTADHPSHTTGEDKKDGGEEGKNKKEEGGAAKKVPAFDKNPKHHKDSYNKHPPAVNNFTIKQPAGKVL